MASMGKPESLSDFCERIYMNLWFSKDVKFLPSFVSEPSVKFLYKELKKCGEIPLPPQPLMKIAANSIQFRQEGNEHYSAYRNFEAFKCFNRAIAHAPAASQQLALAYGNRSAALFDLGQPEACVKDIDRALAIGCDESRKQKLLERRKKCANLKSSTKSNPIADEFRQSVLKSLTKTKPDIPCASEKLTLAYDSVKGRKIIANSGIRPGEVLAIEEPYVKLLNIDRYTTQCYHCIKKSYELIPCDACHYVMFCNGQCKIEAWNQYHKYECPIMFYLTGAVLEDLYGLRVILKARSEYDSWAEFRKAVEQFEVETDPLKKGFIDNVYDSKSYAAIYTLGVNIHKMNGINLYRSVFGGTVIASLLKKYSGFLDKSSKNDMYLVGALIARSTLSVKLNLTSSFIEMRINPTEAFDASAIVDLDMNAFMNLLGHSCYPNAMIQSIGNTTVLLCLRPIKNEDEISICYGESYGFASRSTRRNLLEIYNFICKCEACSNDWVQPVHISKSQKARVRMLPFRIPKRGDQAEAIKMLDNIYHNIYSLNRYGISKELLANIQVLKMCWEILAEPDLKAE